MGYRQRGRWGGDWHWCPAARWGCSLGRVGGKGEVCKGALDSEGWIWGLRAHSINARAGGVEGWLVLSFQFLVLLTTFCYSIMGCTNECKLTMLLIPLGFGWCSKGLKAVLGLGTEALLLVKQRPQTEVIQHLFLILGNKISSLIWGDSNCPWCPVNSREQGPWLPRW